MNNQIMNLNNDLQQMIQIESSSQSGQLAQLNQHLSSNIGSVGDVRAHIAKAEALIQDAISNMEGHGNESLIQNLNQLQTELMNYSQSLEHQVLNQTKSATIPGEPLGTDSDPDPGVPLA